MAIRAVVRYKAEDIWDTPDDGNRYEVIDGEMYVSPPPGGPHQYGSSMLHILVGTHVVQNRLGMLFSAPIGVVLDEGNGVQPDLVFVSRARLEIFTQKGIEGVPDLAVEILSPSTRSRDLGIKMRRYAASGIEHYWLLDPKKKTLVPHVVTDGAYEAIGTYGPGDVFEPELFPGLRIPIDDLWPPVSPGSLRPTDAE